MLSISEINIKLIQISPFAKILIVVFFTSIIQSLYGVGILLFGTPLLLLIGLSFQQTLYVVLPISCIISFIQIVKGWGYIRFTFVRQFLIFTIPFTLLSLAFVLNIKSKFNLNLIVGIYILFFSLSFHFTQIENVINSLINKKKIYLMVCGIIHGLTNLGGSLLSAYLINQYSKKEEVRSTIAFCYLLFVIIQFLVIILFGGNVEVDNKNIIYILTAIFAFFVSDVFLFKRLSDKKFKNYFGHILLIIGVILIIKSF